MRITSQGTTATSIFHINTYGYGWAHEVTCLTTAAALWFQDQDAKFVRDNTENLTNEELITHLFELLCYE